MNTIDRIIRVIYKELALYEFINHPNDVFDCNVDERYKKHFDFLDSDFRNLVRQKYISLYPNNYNPDEIEYTIEELCQRVENRYCRKYKRNAAKLLLYVADELLFINSNEVKVSFDELLELNGFINKIDSNILFAAKLALENKEISGYQKYRVLHDNSRLSTILSKGISENHMHFKGSGYTTEMNWYEFSHYENIALKQFETIVKTRNALTNTREYISFYKIRLVKAYLFSNLYTHANPIYVDHPRKKEMEISKEELEKVLAYSNLENYEYIFVKQKPEHLADASEERFSMKERLSFWKQLFFRRYNKFTDHEKSFFLMERNFLKDLFEQFIRGEMDYFTLYLFNLYLLSVSKFKMFFYQDNEGMGFEKFKYSEDIKENLIEHYGSQKVYQTVFDKYYEEQHVKKIEFRIAPKTSISEYKTMMDEAERADRAVRKKLNIAEEDKIDYGFIVHYIKSKGEFNYKAGESRKEKFYHDLEQKCSALISFFNQYDNVKRNIQDDLLINDNYRNKIVGIDTANYEFNCRPELFGYIFRRQRKEIYTSHRLNFTYHVGEDFTSLANGLRAIDEVIEFLGFGRGDRLGHALALGMDVDNYFKTKRDKITSNMEEYLDDIVWMRYLITADRDTKELNAQIEDKKIQIEDIIRFLEGEFDRCFGTYRCFDKTLSDYTMYDYFCGYRLRGDIPFIYNEIRSEYDKRTKNGSYNADAFYDFSKEKYKEKINFENVCHKEAFLNQNARDLFFRYHFCSKFKRKHNEQIHLPMSDLYREAVRITQYVLRKKIYHSEIGIESNPTSNRKISPTLKYIDLPFFNFSKKHLGTEGKYDLCTSINTDDGGIFQTDLSLEYAYVVATLKREGYDMESIYQYIDCMRENSMHQSFVLPEDKRQKEFIRRCKERGKS